MGCLSFWLEWDVYWNMTVNLGFCFRICLLVEYGLNPFLVGIWWNVDEPAEFYCLNGMFIGGIWRNLWMNLGDFSYLEYSEYLGGIWWILFVFSDFRRMFTVGISFLLALLLLFSFCDYFSVLSICFSDSKHLNKRPSASI